MPFTKSLDTTLPKSVDCLVDLVQQLNSIKGFTPCLFNFAQLIVPYHLQLYYNARRGYRKMKFGCCKK